MNPPRPSARIIWTTPALTDAEAICDYIARDSLRYAADLMARIVGAVERLAQFPESGRKVPELDRPDVRELIVGNYRVVYRLVRQGEVVEIAAVVHAARRFPTEGFTGG